MITYNTFTTITAALGILFYLFVRKDRIDYGLSDIAVEVPCDRAFARLTDVHFLKEMMSDFVLSVELLTTFDDDVMTRSRYRTVETVPYVGEITYETEMKSFEGNLTVVCRSDVWGGYLKNFIQRELKPTGKSQCTIKETQLVFVPLAFSSFVGDLTRKAHVTAMEKMKRLLKEGR